MTHLENMEELLRISKSNVCYGIEVLEVAPPRVIAHTEDELSERNGNLANHNTYR